MNQSPQEYFRHYHAEHQEKDEARDPSNTEDPTLEDDPADPYSTLSKDKVLVVDILRKCQHFLLSPSIAIV